jgi:hypothetical protein
VRPVAEGDCRLSEYLSNIDDRHDRVEKSSFHPGRGMTDLHLLRGHMPHFVATGSRIEAAHKPA